MGKRTEWDSVGGRMCIGRKGELVCRREAASRGGVRALYGIKQAEVESLSRFGRTGHVSDQTFHRLFACVLAFNVPFYSFVST
jgi:hypothetical protein